MGANLAIKIANSEAKRVSLTMENTIIGRLGDCTVQNIQVSRLSLDFSTQMRDRTPRQNSELK